MNNVMIMIVSAFIGLIAYLQCFNNEDMALFCLGMFFAITGFIAGIIGLITGNDFFEM